MRYLILGAGPAGLTFANKLHQSNETSFLVLERENEAGGLCRSIEVDGSPFDFGGGHFLDVRRPHVNKFLFNFMPMEEWEKYDRDSRIVINGSIIKYPIEANIWQMELADQIEYLKSIAVAGCNIGKEKPENFVDWIYWKLGDKIAENYMIPYNQKMFGKAFTQLGIYWLEKLPDVSFEDTLLSCLTKKAYGIQPGHVQFYYPSNYGFGELWLRMAETIKQNIEYGKSVHSIDFKTKTVITSDGGRYSADTIISTIPWKEFGVTQGMPETIKKSIIDLKHSSIQTEYHPENIDSKAQWIYYPNPELSYHRILIRHNFCRNGRGYWTESNSERITMENSVIKLNDSYKHMNQYAYPLNTIKKPEIISRLLKWSSTRGIIGLGRWGEHQHYNTDVVVEKALNLANRLLENE